MKLLSLVAGISFLFSSQAFADIIVYASGGICSDLGGMTTVQIDFEHRGPGGVRDWGTTIANVSCGSYSSSAVYVTSDAYCTVSSFGCPGGTGSVYCYKGAESSGAGFSLTCPM